MIEAIIFRSVPWILPALDGETTVLEGRERTNYCKKVNLGVAGGRSKENSTLVFSLWSEMFNEKRFFATSLKDICPNLHLIQQKVVYLLKGS